MAERAGTRLPGRAAAPGYFTARALAGEPTPPVHAYLPLASLLNRLNVAPENTFCAGGGAVERPGRFQRRAQRADPFERTVAPAAQLKANTRNSGSKRLMRTPPFEQTTSGKIRTAGRHIPHHVLRGSCV